MLVSFLQPHALRFLTLAQSNTTATATVWGTNIDVTAASSAFREFLDEFGADDEEADGIPYYTRRMQEIGDFSEKAVSAAEARKVRHAHTYTHINTRLCLMPKTSHTAACTLSNVYRSGS